MACVVVLSLMRTLELEFLQSLPRPILQQKELIPCNKHLVLSLHNKLGSLMELFDENRMDGVEAIKDLETKLRDVAFRIEDEIELQVAHLYHEEEKGKEEDEEEEFRIFEGIFDIFDRIVDQAFHTQDNTGEKSTHHRQRLHQKGTHHCQKFYQILHPPTGKSHPCLRLRRILHPAIEDIDGITEELAKVKEEYQLFKHHLQGGTKQPASLHVLPIPTMPDSSHHASRSKGIMVGKQVEFEIIKEKLIQHPSKQLEVVSIKGMAGIGKTTLAKQIYEDPSITSYFDKRAWTVASQHHSKRQMLLDLLGSKHDADKRSDGDLALQLYQSFKKYQRYLVVMDDVWNVEAWYALKTCFPDDGNGCRILLTTRLAEVANHICIKDNFSHQMQLLEQSESWQLFYEKACKSRGAEFGTIGRPVVEKCKGLPLAIIVVAGLFSKLNTLDEWKNIANALSSSSATTLDDEECSRILSLSYNHLTHNLKACFLYLGIFPEDHEINTNEFTKLWLAEGLVKAFENDSFDAVANRYVQELMDRNLTILSQLSSCGRKVKEFRHDLLHAFCVRKAQKHNLLHVVQSESSSYFPQKGFRWVSIQSVDFNMSTIQHYTLKSYRSFFSFLWGKSFSEFRTGNLLRVLFCYDGCVRLNNIVDPVHLRFIRVGNRNIELSRAYEFLKSRRRESIELSRSWNLQTLDCYGRVSYGLDEGGKFSHFPQLHYICCNDNFCGNPPNFVKKLYWISADDCSKEYITNIPCLKKVGIQGEGRESNACIANLAYLEQLEGLRILSRFGTHSPINNDIVLLKNLRKLALDDIRFEWEKINILSKLPRLEVLKLLWNSCVGKEWKIFQIQEEEVIFCQLITLVIAYCNLERWEASSHNFPKLEHLYTRYCSELREIPIDFAEISTLKSIKLMGCLHSAVESVKKIQDEQRNYGNNDMVVIEKETLDVLKSEKGLSEEARVRSG